MGWQDDPIEAKPWEADPIEGQKKPVEQNYLAGLARTALGQGGAFGFGDEITAGARALLGEKYEDAVKDEREKVKQFRQDNPVTSFAGEMAGGFATPGLGLLTGAVKVAKTGLGRVAQGSAIGSGLGAVHGLGSAEGDLEERLPGAAGGAAAGAVIGGALPVVGAAVGKAASATKDAVSPTLARWKADLDAVRRKYGVVASADGGMPTSAGANAAADQIIANQLHRAGRSVDDLRGTLTEAGEASRFHSSGRAQDALAPVDLDPSLQRLAGSVARASPEAGNAAQAFVSGRQTGITPAGGLLPETAGIPTRPMLARPKADDPPMGQGDRLRDAFKRALLIRDEDFHGHAANALRTDKAILEAARGEAKALYGDAYKAGQNVNIAPALEPVLQKWQARLVDEPKPVAAMVQRVMGLFSTKNGLVSNVERFDKSKQFADGVIEKFFESPIGRNRYVGGVLNEFKNDMLKAVDAVNAGGLGQKYSAARAAFGSRMEAREALQAGRDVFKADADAGVDAFRALTTPGQQKLFRLGMLSGYEKAAAGMKRGADKTQIFDNPRIQELLSEVIPRTETATGRAKAGAVFADRPERLGRYIGNEKRMIETRDQVLGNSKTAQRLKDDEAFNDMNALNSAIDKFRQSGSVLNVAVKAVESLLNKLFGMRADTAASLAQKLFTANPMERERLLAAVAQRMGPDRFSHFSRLMQQYQAAIAPAGVSAGNSISGQ